MLQFSDISFWPVFLLFLAIYALMRRYTRMGMLIYVVAFNMLFFWLANGWMMLLVPAVAIVSWGASRVLSPVSGADADYRRLRKLTLALAIAVLLLPLLYFKYSNFFLATVNSFITCPFRLFNLILPVGISFFTFQAISYLVDVYRGRFTTRVSFLEYFFYLSFFPLLLAGPITRASHFFPQLRQSGAVPERCLYLGLWLVMLGLVKKCLIADYIAQYNDWIFSDPLGYSGFECLMGILGYTIQIYCDFSGYSDMSIGIAAMLGFRLRENFAFPYRACNLSDFWGRWHISLSSWFRDYLYIPLGGNRCSCARTYLNNIITMLFAGLWHGASWMFVAWGGIHGIGLVVDKMFRRLFARFRQYLWYRAICSIITFTFVALAWVFFRCDSMATACLLLSRSISDFDIAYFMPFVTVRPWWCVFVLIPLLAHNISDRQFLRLQTRFIILPWWVKLVLFAVILQIVVQFSTSSVQPFIYYQF